MRAKRYSINGACMAKSAKKEAQAGVTEILALLRHAFPASESVHYLMALVMLRHRRNAAQGDLLHLAGAEAHAAAATKAGSGHHAD